MTRGPKLHLKRNDIESGDKYSNSINGYRCSFRAKLDWAQRGYIGRFYLS